MNSTAEITETNYDIQQAEQYAIEAEQAASNQVEEPQEVENEYFVLGYN